ncbi:septal ring lytic transglycosylase RlpA family protein [Nodosilinea sp. E11]|uniref:septal ring lytic transglycosylase RlpA family protein n=1 Tax=Nodosilinea sp. E11 TaxID=3037479 RepID=UPI002934364A|nr:septal ring lytic transglycosylase RlpA family protein [Nodosilinea sp. E11]WOD38172.1 septal ring lytic transglycosylase RlpA family protein [Nodosilinea sp. E11]
MTLQPANPYAAAHLQRQSTVDLSASSPYTPRHLQALANQPLTLQPQLTWPATATVDWQHWSATAAVAVVDRDHTAHASSGVTEVVRTANVCGGYHVALSSDVSSDVALSSDAEGFTIQVKNVVIGRVTSRPVADAIAQQLRQAIPVLEASPSSLMPSLSQHHAAAQVDGKTVLTLVSPDQTAATTEGKPLALQAAQWVNNLRLAFGAAPLDTSQMQMAAHGLGETHQTFGGIASWYGPYFHGRQTATGETFNQHDLTAAHKTLPFGTHLKVRNQLNGKTVVVRINDRGPYIEERSLDLSYAAAQCLGGDEVGVIPYQATILAPGYPHAWRENVVATRP